jgi:hypothetical protein
MRTWRISRPTSRRSDPGGARRSPIRRASRPERRSPRSTAAPRVIAPGSSGRSRPRLAGQDLEYLLRLLRAFKARTASDLDGTMTVATQPLTDDEIVSLVHFIATVGEP